MTNYHRHDNLCDGNHDQLSSPWQPWQSLSLILMITIKLRCQRTQERFQLLRQREDQGWAIISLPVPQLKSLLPSGMFLSWSLSTLDHCQFCNRGVCCLQGFLIIMIIDHTPVSFDNTFLIDLDILDPPPMGVFTSDISARLNHFLASSFTTYLHYKCFLASTFTFFI